MRVGLSFCLLLSGSCQWSQPAKPPASLKSISAPSARGQSEGEHPSKSEPAQPNVITQATHQEPGGVIVTPTSDLRTSESGTSASFSLRLTSKPQHDCLITLWSSNRGEGVPMMNRVHFTSQTWNLPQTVVVRGLDDAVADGPQNYFVRFDPIRSEDIRYAGMAVPAVELSNDDNDKAGFIVQPSGGLVTSEEGGTAVFLVALDSMPQTQVRVNVASSDITEGQASPSVLVFSQSNWSRPQTVTVKGVDDTTADGAQSYRIMLSADAGDPMYRRVASLDVSVTNNERALNHAFPYYYNYGNYYYGGRYQRYRSYPSTGRAYGPDPRLQKDPYRHTYPKGFNANPQGSNP